jgi:hypothetical protein
MVDVARAELTPEQLLLYEKFETGTDCKLMAHAGAGKSSCLFAAWAKHEATLRLAKKEPQTAWVVLYNKNMQEDGSRKAQDMKCEHVAVFTFDAIIKRFYEPASPSLNFDVAMHRVVLQKTLPLEKISFDVLAVDEAQDMDELKWQFACLLRRHAAMERGGREPQLVLAGDAKQTIFQYNGARASILVDRNCSLISLSKSYRCSPRICALVNERFRGVFESGVWCSDMETHRGHSQDEDDVRIWNFNVLEARTRGMLWDLAKHYAEVCKKAAEVKGRAVAVLAYTTKPANSLLWAFLEVAQSEYEAPRIAITPTPGRPFLSTVFSTKGCEYWATFVFVCHEGLASNARWSAELLYTGLTRASNVLHVVQDYPYFEESWCLGSGVVYHCASVTSACPELANRVGGNLSRPPTRKVFRDYVRPNIEGKEAVIADVRVTETIAYDSPAECELDGKLIKEALAMRAEHLVFKKPLCFSFDASEDILKGQFQDFLRRENRRTVWLLPEAEELLVSLGRHEGGPEGWSMQQWYDLASLVHPDYHFGHVFVPALDELEAANSLYDRFAAQWQVHLDALRRQSSCDKLEMSLRLLPFGEGGGKFEVTALVDSQGRAHGLLEVSPPVLSANGATTVGLYNAYDVLALQTQFGAPHVDIVRVQGPHFIVRVCADSPMATFQRVLPAGSVARNEEQPARAQSLKRPRAA